MIHKKIDKWNAIIFFDEDNKLYTIVCSGKGGAIISDANLEEAERKFSKAMNIAEKCKQQRENFTINLN